MQKNNGGIFAKRVNCTEYILPCLFQIVKRKSVQKRSFPLGAIAQRRSMRMRRGCFANDVAPWANDVSPDGEVGLWVRFRLEASLREGGGCGARGDNPPCLLRSKRHPPFYTREAMVCLRAKNEKKGLRQVPQPHKKHDTVLINCIRMPQSTRFSAAASSAP